MDGRDGQLAGAKLETSQATLWVEDGVLHIVYNSGTDIDLGSARDLLEAEANVLDGARAPAFIDLSGTLSITRDARALFAGPEAAAVQTATALLVTSPLSRMLGNMFLGLNKTISPTRLFSNRTDALEWLEQFK